LCKFCEGVKKRAFQTYMQCFPLTTSCLSLTWQAGSLPMTNLPPGFMQRLSNYNHYTTVNELTYLAVQREQGSNYFIFLQLVLHTSSRKKVALCSGTERTKVLVDRVAWVLTDTIQFFFRLCTTFPHHDRQSPALLPDH
jgi:hypothetical protein